MHSNSAARSLEKPTDYKEQKHYLGSLAYLAAMPFHHLLSAADILTNRVIPNNIISAKLFYENFSGEEFEADWTAVLREPVQGCAEIYRAEMFLFKKMIYEMKEELTSPLTLTDRDFSKYLDYEMFKSFNDGLRPEKLLIHSLAAGFDLSVSKIDNRRKREQEQESENGNKSRNQSGQSETGASKNISVLTDRIHGWESIPVGNLEKLAEIENQPMFDIFPSTESKTDEKLFKISFDLFKNSAVNSHDDLQEDQRKGKEKENGFTVYRLNIGSYWLRWQEAARAAGMDFDLLEKLYDVPTIRFYELTRFFRLISSGQNAPELSNELEIEYELFTQLMPLPRFRSRAEIKKQIKDLIQPLVLNGYVRDFWLAEDNPIKDSVQRLNFEFCN